MNDSNSVILSGIAAEPPTPLYPIISVEEIDKKVKTDGDRARAKILLNKKQELTTNLDRYTKLKVRWTEYNDIVRSIGHTISALLALATVVFSCPLGINIPTIIPIVLGSLTGIDTTITELIARRYTRRRKYYFADKCSEVISMMDKANYLFYKALIDGVITDNELAQFTQLIDTGIKKLQDDDKQEQATSDNFFRMIRSTAKDRAAEEFKETKIAELKAIELNALNQKYSSV